MLLTSFNTGSYLSNVARTVYGCWRSIDEGSYDSHMPGNHIITSQYINLFDTLLF